MLPPAGISGSAVRASVPKAFGTALLPLAEGSFTVCIDRVLIFSKKEHAKIVDWHNAYHFANLFVICRFILRSIEISLCL